MLIPFMTNDSNNYGHFALIALLKLADWPGTSIYFEHNLRWLDLVCLWHVGYNSYDAIKFRAVHKCRILSL